jgi:methionyl-tRNA synthetase
MNDILYALVCAIFKITKFLYPIIPIAAQKLLDQIGCGSSLNLDAKENIPNVLKINEPENLFSKIDTSDMSKFDVFASD